MTFIPKPHEIYKYFKGNLYQITAVAEHTETGEQLVIYQALYGDFKTYAQPLAMFTERLDRNQYPDAEQIFRFELQGPEAERQRAQMSTDEPVLTVQTKDVCSGAESCTQGGGSDKADTDVEDMAFRRTEDAAEDEITLDPMVLEFLDSDSYEQKLNILAGIHHRITDDMITTMAIACDIEISDGDVEERYEALRTCLLTLERYECNRLR